MSRILVTGATGHLGTDAVNFLVDRMNPSDISILARNPAKAEELRAKGVDVRQGDYEDYESLVKAFQGIDKLYFIASNDLVNRLHQHENVVKAAVEAGVKHVVFTSFQRRSDEIGGSPIAALADVYIKTEQLLKESGLVYTIMKHALYADALPMFLGDKVLETGVIYQPSGDGKTSFTLRSDMAEAGAIVLTTPGHENKTYEIAANSSYSFHDIARILTEVTGKTISYVSPTPEEFQTTLLDAGVPKDYIGFLIGFAKAIQQGGFNFPGTALETLLGRKPVSLEEYLKGVYGK